MTREEILAMEPGRELDDLVGKTFGFAPRIKWYAMNKDETAFYMDFETQLLAESWHSEMANKYPNGRYATNGGHIVRREIYKRFSEEISAAWEIYLKVIDGYFSQRGRFYMGLQDLTAHGDTYAAWPDVLTVLAKVMPESICKAALLAVMEGENHG